MAPRVFQAVKLFLSASQAVDDSHPLPVSVVAGGGSSSAPSTGTASSVVGNNASTAILAANASRRGAAIHNDSTATLYLLLSANTASTTTFTVKIPADGYYEVPFGYTGAINGIWSAVNGAARITEFA